MTNKEAIRILQFCMPLNTQAKCEAIDLAISALKDERLQGKWIFHKDYHESCRYGCNQCGNLTNINSRFCPNCGAKMKKAVLKCCGKCVNFRMDDPLHNIGHCVVNRMERFSEEANEKCTHFKKVMQNEIN